MLSWLRGDSHEYEAVRTTSAHTRDGDATALHITNREVLQPARAATAAAYDEENPGALHKAKQASQAALQNVKGFLGIRDPIPDSERTYADDLDEMLSLTRTQRLYGFVMLFGVGWVLSLLSLIAVPQVALHPEKFALLYTAGNIVSLCSTACLWGPCAQIRDMFKAERVVATTVYLMSMVVTLVCAFKLHMLIPTLIALLVQMCAMVS